MTPKVDPDDSSGLLALANHAAAGDDAAARELLRAVWPAMTRTIVGVLGPGHPDVEDVSQESMIGFLRALAAFRGECHPAGYASRIALHTALRARRRAKLSRSRADEMARLAVAEERSTAPSDAASERRRRILRELLEDLPTEQAEALALRVVLGWTLEEVALATGAPVNTVRSRVRLAKEALRRHIEANPHLIEDLEVGIMSIVDLHPEELLDKHARGLLSEQERARLDAHVATCAVCRFELSARDDFASEAAAMLGAGSPARAKRPAPDASTDELGPTPRIAGRSRRRAWVVGLAAALIGGMSFAALTSGVLRSERTTSHKPKTEAHTAPPIAMHAPRLEPSGPATGDEVATLATAAPVPAAPPAQTGEAVGTASRDGATAHAARTTPTAAELFRSANAARRAHDSERAIALYRELEARYPRSEEARVSFATLGTLMLDHGDPRAALDGFNRYLARGETALGEEALVGRALASRKLGAREAEIAAWQEVLRRFPSSIHAELARTRLAELGDR